jgi:hypothetical protein
MQRFHFINNYRTNPDPGFLDMKTFWESIENKNKANSQNIFSPFNEQLDLFYICLLVGLKLEVKDDISNYEISGINDRWTVELKNSKATDYIIGFFLSKITKQYKDDKSKISKALNETLDHESDSKLSDLGMRELHNYVIGGYNKILSELDNKTPSTLVKFFDVIYKLLK